MPATASTAAGADAPPRDTLEISAAASLTDAFTEVARRFRTVEPGVVVHLNFAGSSALAAQVAQGAPVDVIATADEVTMRRLSVDGLLASDAFVAARNRLALLVAPGNPVNVQGLADLARPDVATAVCAPQVPCGRYAARALGQAGVDLTPRSFEDSVKGVVTQVRLGEADAGIVYVTDARAAAGSADAILLPVDQDVFTAVPVAVPRTVRNERAARAFVRFLLSTTGQAILRDAGFQRA